VARPGSAATLLVPNQIWISVTVTWSSGPQQIAEKSIPPIQVEMATWSPGGQADWWVKERREWSTTSDRRCRATRSRQPEAVNPAGKP
jgi:hypothetical protein